MRRKQQQERNTLLLIPHNPFVAEFQEEVTPLPGYDNARYYPYHEAGAPLDAGNENCPWRVWDRKKGIIAFYGTDAHQAIERCGVLNLRWEKQAQRTNRRWRVHPLYIGYWKVAPREVGHRDGIVAYRLATPATIASVRREGILRAHLYPASIVPNGWGCEQYLGGFTQGFADEGRATPRAHTSLEREAPAERREEAPWNTGRKAGKA